MSNEMQPRVAAPGATLDSVFGDLWPDPATPGRRRLVGAAVGVGGLAALVLPFRSVGLGTFVVLASVLAVVTVAARGRRTPELASYAALCLLLVSTVLLRDALWIVALCVLAAAAVGSVALAEGRSLVGILASTAAVPVATLRGAPWLVRSMHTVGRAAALWRLARTVLVSVALLLVFGTLFASADVIFAGWVDVLVPDLSFDSLALRLFVLVAVAAGTFAGVFVALAPPAVDRLVLPTGRPVRRYEWAVPVGLVAATFAVFLAAQVTALFGGHAYLSRTTGLTYAEYVHQGFGQLVVATLLTLAVIGVVVRRAGKDTAVDRIWLRVLLGLLCALTLVVVASALYRIHLYEEAYGFTRLRLLVSVFEAWLGVVLLLVLLAGVRLRGPWVPRVALLTGAVLLLGLATINPDAYIATRNIERYEQTGKIDVHYLAGLAADAVPALDTLPEPLRSCALQGHVTSQDDWLEWNLGRARAASVQAGRTSTSTPTLSIRCSGLPSASDQ